MSAVRKPRPRRPACCVVTTPNRRGSSPKPSRSKPRNAKGREGNSMATEIKVPTLGESVTEATVARWLKQPGDTVAMDDPLVELETDKVTLEVNAPAAGTLSEVLVAEGANVGVGAILGVIGEGAAKVAPAAAKPAAAAAKPASAPAPAPAKPAAAPAANGAADILARSGPAARKAAAETGVDVTKIAPTGKDGRVTKTDIAAAASAKPAPAPVAREPRDLGPREERVRMTRLRKRIAERLKDAQNTAAMLTTFNEADMTEVMALRERYRESFEKQHGVRLGFMSIFAKACIQALKEIPAANAEIDGDDIIYKNHYDLGIAVGTEQGLVVPVVRDADQLSFAEIEKRVADLGRRA